MSVVAVCHSGVCTLCRHEQISESVDDVISLKSDAVDSATGQQEDDTSVACSAELLEESESVEPQTQAPVDELDTSGEVDNKVDTAAGLAPESTAPERDAETTEDTTHGSTDVVSTVDESDASCEAVSSQTVPQDPLTETKDAMRLPKAAANILRMPYDSIRRRDGESLRSASSDDVADVAGVESPAAAGPGLMSRTLGSITALPSLFSKSTDSGAAATTAATPSPPRSACDKSERSPGSSKPRTFFFHRLVGRSPANSTDVDTTDANKSADDGNVLMLASLTLSSIPFSL